MSILLILFLSVGYRKNEVYANTEHTVSEIMDLTGILKDENGASILHKKYATRAEFARILVQSSENSGKVGQNNRLKLFSDVSKNNTYSSYIHIAVTNSYMSGYINGKFKPKKSVTYKEAVYGMLTLLGYTNEDFSGQITDARMIKFNELGLAKKLSLEPTDKLTKSDCEILFYNLLHAKQKSGELYGKNQGYSFDSNNIIDYQALFTAKTKGPIITTSGWTDSLSKKISKYTIIKNNSKVSVSDIKDNNIAYYAEQANTIWIYNEQIYGTIESINYSQGEPQDITVSGNTYLVENPSTMKNLLKQNNIKKGSLVVLLLGQNDKISHIVPIQSTVATGDWQQQLTFTLSKGHIYKNNVESTVSAIENQDVIYYANELETVWVFHQRIFGALKEIISSQGEPQELNVSGTSYTIAETKRIKERLKTASIQTKMPVVLFLGWDNMVYDIVSLSSVVVDGDWKSSLSFSLDESTIYKNGSIITKDSISSYDVVYYSNELKTVWVYSNKIYGLLKTISPNSASPDSVIIANKTYTFDLPPINSTYTLGNTADDISQNAWGERLRTRGINEGQNVVVLFGFNGYVADILPLEKMPVTITGYVLKIENQLVNNSNQTSSVKPILQLVDTQGTLREYPCSDISIQPGMIVEVSFSSGQPVFKKLNATGFSISSNITSKKFAENAHILEVMGEKYTVLTTAQMSDIYWSQGNVLYYKCNTAGDITELVLYQVSYSSYQYGILKSVNSLTNGDDSSILQYVFSFGDTDTTLTTELSKWNMNLVPKAVLIDNNQIQEMHDLTGVRISYISNMQANTGDAVYWIADDVSVYFYKKGVYYNGSLKDITNFTSSIINGYRDTLGPIRIIVVTE